jgi:hypothetical protein
MAKPFHELRERLLRAGVAPRHVRRYLTELTDHLADLRAEEERAGRSRADAESAALVRLGGMDDLAKALLLLAGAWFVALFILWSGWQIFLPGADTPFGAGRVYGFANLYFQAGKALYFGAPILVGWGIGLIAVRQRLKTLWPMVGLVLIVGMGGTSQVQASRTAVHGGVGHIRMDFALGTSVHGLPGGLMHALVILSLTMLPYLIWRLQKARSLSA